MSFPLALDEAAAALVLPVEDVALAATRLSDRGWLRLDVEGSAITLTGSEKGRAAATTLRDRITDVERHLLCPLTGQGVDRVRVALRAAAARAGAPRHCPLSPPPPRAQDTPPRIL
jgi:hypothetical protein